MKNKSNRVARRGPFKFTAGILVLLSLVAYVILRPALERRLGVRLPSVGRRLSESNGDRPAEPLGRERDDRNDENSASGSLTETRSGEYVSQSGLRYGRGGERGFRLRHVLRHDDDQPNRDGPHGVFDGNQDDLLSSIDEAYRLVKAGSPRVTTRRDGRRTIHEIDMRRRIGFVGGRTGKRKGHPAVTHVRLILEGDRVITAYPFQP